MRMRVQAQHMQIGDKLGSGEVVSGLIVNSVKFPADKVYVTLMKNDEIDRGVLWGKRTMINVERL